MAGYATAPAAETGGWRTVSPPGGQQTADRWKGCDGPAHCCSWRQGCSSCCSRRHTGAGGSSLSQQATGT